MGEAAVSDIFRPLAPVPPLNSATVRFTISAAITLQIAGGPLPTTDVLSRLFFGDRIRLDIRAQRLF